MKRIVPLVVLVFALAVPAAALADGNPAPAHGGRVQKLHAVKRQLRRELHRCLRSEGADRQACVQKIVARLDALKQRIDAVEAKVQQACPGAQAATDSTSAPAGGDKCSRAPRLLARLERMKQRIDQLVAKLQSVAGNDASGSTSSGSDSASANADSIASLEAQLAAVEAQNG